MDVKTVLLYSATLILPLTLLQQKSSCNDYLSYLSVFSSDNCYYNPDLYSDVEKIVQRHIGSFETHRVQTEDGYILTVFRIPQHHPKGVIVLQHGMAQSSRIWVAQQNDSVAFVFWKAGYDVWLANFRGTRYSRNHTRLTPDQAAFWDFSLYELGYFDTHAVVEYVKVETNQSRIVHLGVSMGGAAGLVYASLRPNDAADSLSGMVPMAPYVVLSRFSMFNQLVTLASTLHPYQDTTGIYTLLSHDSWYVRLLKAIAMTIPFKKLVPYSISFISGWTPDEFDPRFANDAAVHLDSPLSLKIAHHYSQMYKANGLFQMYDYGEKGNLQMYGFAKPPLFPLEKTKTSVFVVYGSHDTISRVEDNQELLRKLPGDVVLGQILVDNFNHLDFFFGRRRTEMYDKIMKLLENTTN